MKSKLYDCSQERLELYFERPLCAWCKYPFKPIHRAGLCRHCYAIKTELRQNYRNYLPRKANTHGELDILMSEFHLRISINMAEAAQTEGRIYGALHQDSVSNLDLEHAFGSLSERLLSKDLYDHDANLFECFSESQNRYLMYLISRMLREHNRRNRRKMFLYNTDTLEQTFKRRAPGTYRVEDDLKASPPRKK